MRWFKLIALTALAVPASALAQAQSCALPAQIPIPYASRPDRGELPRKISTQRYLLALSWSPEYCSDKKRRDRDPFQCGKPNRFGFILHGLWPEGDGRDNPAWCRPAKIVPAPVIRQNLCMTPSVWLIQHEWAKHGTCMSPRPDVYFKAASILYRAVRYPDMAALSKRMQTVGTFKRAFAAVNPGIGPDMLAVQTSKGGWLQEVRFCLDRRMKPTRCLSSQQRAHNSKLLRIR